MNYLNRAKPAKQGTSFNLQKNIQLSRWNTLFKNMLYFQNKLMSGCV